MKKIISKVITATKKIGTLNIILLIVGLFFMWFNWQMLEIFRACGSIPESYAGAVIAATIGECGICGWIRTNKDKKREHEWERELNIRNDSKPIHSQYETNNNTADEEIWG